MSAQHQMRAATNVPSAVAPSLTRTIAGWRLSVWNSSARPSTAFTGRPDLRASAATIASRRTNVFAPNEPPIGSQTTRTPSGSIPKMRARSERTLNGVCVPVHTSSRPSRHRATDACGSMCACCAPAVRYVSSTTTSARANAASGSPRRMRKRWQMLVPACGRMSKYAASFSETSAVSWTSGAPGSLASSGSNTDGNSS